MHTLSVLIVEDNTLVAEDLTESLEDLGYDVIDKVKTGEKAILSAKKNSPDLILMDINLNGDLDGIDAASEIGKFTKIPIIYLTAYSDHKTYNRAKATNPYAFIVKPFDEQDLSRAIDLAIQNFALTNVKNSNENLESHFVMDDVIFLKIDKRYIKIPIDSIIYLVAHGSYTKLHTINNEHLLVMNLHSFESKIQHPNLMRIHRSYIVNLKKVDSFEKNYLIIGNISFNISKQYQDSFKKRFMTA